MVLNNVNTKEVLNIINTKEASPIRYNNRYKSKRVIVYMYT